ncbi:MAG: Fe-S cluster assembly ATPase SufC [bacterium]|nr:Fe-S cluster assembly ATPase SufC [bacterium]
MLEIKDLHVSTQKKEILRGISLKIKPGEIHALMGPNGSGKSSLSMALMGHPQYQITKGEVILDGQDISALSVDKRAKAGLFLAMQYPVAVAGVSINNFMRSAYKNLKDPGVKALEIQNKVKNELNQLKLDEKFISRAVNEGFSGGEKKKLETLQLTILEPKYAILDETDSGLDVDALKIVSKGVMKAKEKDQKLGILLITHYQRILRYIQPDFVHILVDGKIVKSGDKDLALEIEEKGYQEVSS